MSTLITVIRKEVKRFRNEYAGVAVHSLPK